MARKFKVAREFRGVGQSVTGPHIDHARGRAYWAGYIDVDGEVVWIKEFATEGEAISRTAQKAKEIAADRLN